MFVAAIGTVGGGFGGFVGGFVGAIILSPTLDLGIGGSLMIITGTGGGAMLGYKLGSNIFKREYKVEEFEGWTLDKKRNHLKSKVKQLSGLQKIFQSFTYEID